MGLFALCYWMFVTYVHRKLWEFDQIDIEIDRCGGLHYFITFFDDYLSIVKTIKLKL